VPADAEHTPLARVLILAFGIHALVQIGAAVTRQPTMLRIAAVGWLATCAVCVFVFVRSAIAALPVMSATGQTDWGEIVLSLIVGTILAAITGYAAKTNWYFSRHPRLDTDGHVDADRENAP
jgi:hypothetical protein